MWKESQLFVLLIIVSVAVFGVSLPNPYYFDDFSVLQDNGYLHGLTPPLFWFRSLFLDSGQVFEGYRPTLMLSFLGNIWLLGDHASSLRLGNICLHTLNAYLLIRVIRLLLSPGKEFLAWSTGFLFLLHPIQTLAINFVWKRSSILEATFLLLSLLFHVQERMRVGPYRWRMLGLQFLLYFLVITTKESGIILGPLLILSDVLFFDVYKTVFQRRGVVLYVSLFLMACGFYWFRVQYLISLSGQYFDHLPNRRLISQWEYFQTSLRILPEYIGLWLWPQPRLMDDPAPAMLFPWSSAVATGLFMVLSILMSLRFFTHRMVAFAHGLFWLGLAPTLGVVPIYLVMDQIRLYLPLAGLGFLMVFCMDTFIRFSSTRIQPRAVLIVLVVLYAICSFAQNLRYRSPLHIWEDVVEKYPRGGIGLEHLGAVLDSYGQYRSAAQMYDRAYRAEPENSGYLVSSFLSSFRGGVSRDEIRKGIGDLSAKRLDVRQTMNLAILEAEMGDIHQAEKRLVELSRTHPTYASIHINLAVLWEKHGKLSDSRKAYANALLLAPNNEQARQGLARLGAPRSRM